MKMPLEDKLKKVREDVIILVHHSYTQMQNLAKNWVGDWAPKDDKDCKKLLSKTDKYLKKLKILGNNGLSCKLSLVPINENNKNDKAKYDYNQKKFICIEVAKICEKLEKNLKEISNKLLKPEYYVSMANSCGSNIYMGGFFAAKAGKMREQQEKLSNLLLIMNSALLEAILEEQRIFSKFEKTVRPMITLYMIYNREISDKKSNTKINESNKVVCLSEPKPYLPKELTDKICEYLAPKIKRIETAKLNKNL